VLISEFSILLQSFRSQKTVKTMKGFQWMASGIFLFFFSIQVKILVKITPLYS